MTCINQTPRPRPRAAGIDEHVGQVSEGRAIGDHAREPDLALRLEDPNGIELRMARATVSRGTPGDQYDSRNQPQIVSRSRRAGSVEMEYGGRSAP